MEDVAQSHLLDDWFDRSSEYEHRHKLHLYGPYFLGAKEIMRLNPYNESFFTIIGYLPAWKAPMAAHEDFARIIRRHFAHTWVNTRRTAETVEEIGGIFAAAP